MDDNYTRRTYTLPIDVADDLTKLFDGNRKAQGAFISSIIQQAVTKMKKQKNVDIIITFDMTRMK